MSSIVNRVLTYPFQTSVNREISFNQKPWFPLIVQFNVLVCKYIDNFSTSDFPWSLHDSYYKLCGIILLWQWHDFWKAKKELLRFKNRFWTRLTNFIRMLLPVKRAFGGKTSNVIFSKSNSRIKSTFKY